MILLNPSHSSPSSLPPPRHGHLLLPGIFIRPPRFDPEALPQVKVQRPFIFLVNAQAKAAVLLPGEPQKLSAYAAGLPVRTDEQSRDVIPLQPDKAHGNSVLLPDINRCLRQQPAHLSLIHI